MLQYQCRRCVWFLRHGYTGKFRPDSVCVPRRGLRGGACTPRCPSDAKTWNSKPYTRIWDSSTWSHCMHFWRSSNLCLTTATCNGFRLNIDIGLSSSALRHNADLLPTDSDFRNTGAAPSSFGFFVDVAVWSTFLARSCQAPSPIALARATSQRSWCDGFSMTVAENVC